jgi:hypothetical protein
VQEPDPRDDLSGTDVARKLTILTRLCSTQTPSLPYSLLPDGYASVPTSSLVPDVLQGCKSKEEYVERLEEGDAEMDRLREEAFKEGKVVRYVGVIDAKSGKVEAKLEKWVACYLRVKVWDSRTAQVSFRSSLCHRSQGLRQYHLVPYQAVGLFFPLVATKLIISAQILA